MQFGPIPADIKGCQHFMKLAEDHDDRNVVVAYYSRMAAIQLAMKIVQGVKPPEVSKYLLAIMQWLEETKKQNMHVEGIGNETVAQALIEEYMLKLYNFAYNNDCNETFNKNVVKAYYTASLLCEVLNQFGPLSEDLEEKSKTAKYRATYIHNMLKSGLEPTGINRTVVSNEDEESEYAVSKEEINRRRALRGEDPITDDSPSIDPDELAERRKAAEEIRSTLTDDEEAKELQRLKAEIDKMEIQDVDEEPLPEAPVTSEQIIELGPPDYPEPRLPPPPMAAPSTPIDVPAPSHISAPSGSSCDLINSSAVASLRPEQNDQAVKYCKWASSSLMYDDIKTAINNLEKALYLCKFGTEKP